MSKITNKKTSAKEEKNIPIKKVNLYEKFTSNNILIAIRVRPLNDSEKEDSDYHTIKILSNDTLTISIPTEYSFEQKSKINHIEIKKEKLSKYHYDFVFNESTTQTQVYDITTYNLLHQVLEGYNATIFAYGATGTGKTYTMVGDGTNYGIMIRAIRGLFNLTENLKSNEKNYFIKISYIEIYNEIIKDLLSVNSNNVVDLISDAKKGLILRNALIKKVSNESEAFNLIMKGNKNRTEKNTDYNNNSSRSHAILNIYIESEEKENNHKQKKSFGKFMLIDLAGCEKTSLNNNSINKELGSINKSLLALNKCITLLVTKNRGFIPWRESNLTRLLQESLGGNGKIVMIATVSMALTAFDETMFTLQFANRAKKLKLLNIKRNIETIDVGINKYDEIINDIKEEIVEVKNDIIKQNQIIEKKINAPIEKNKLMISNNKKEQAKGQEENDKKIVKNENKYDKIYRDMMEHFKSEIKLKEKIFEKENIIEELKNDMAEKEYEVLHTSDINLPPLQKQIKDKKEEINQKSNKLLKGYIKQSELMNKRKEFQKVISFLSNNTPNNPEYFKLYNNYKYNISLLENMNIEHKQFLNMQESKRKDRKIEGLMEQLDLRDKIIRNAYEQFEKNGLEFDYINPNLIKSDEIDKIPFKPKTIKIQIKKQPLKDFFDNKKFNSTNQSNKLFENQDTINVNKNDEIIEKKLKLKKLKIKNYRKNKNQSDIDEVYNNSLLTHKNSKNNNELFSMIKKSKNGFNINDFIRNKNIDVEKNSLNSIKSLSINKFKNNFNNNIPFSDRAISTKKIYFNNEGNKISKNKSMIENFENEVQRKIKKILKKNYIARYKRSPFLKLLGE